MQLYTTDPLFAWARLEDHPPLATLRDLLAALPDADLLDGLRRGRGQGRDDYPVEQGLPQPSGGNKGYTDGDGRVTKVVEWFGYKWHLLVDVKHEVPLAYHISDTKAGDNEVLPQLVEQAKANLAEGRMKTLAYDKAADDGKVYEYLHGEQIKPLIHNRELWQEEPERPLPGPPARYPLHVLHDEAGTVYCYDRVSDPPVRHRMAYVGYEKGRETLK